LSCLVGCAALGGIPRSLSWGDLNGDGILELVCVLGAPGEPFGRRVAVFFHDRPPWMGLEGLGPWKVAVGDVDGDGLQELVVGVWKKTRLDPVHDKRLFVFGWSQDGPFPRWLGSRLSRPLVDFELSSSKQGHVDLVAVERDRQGQLTARTYAWNGFGFTAIDETPERR